jgi:DNA-binding Lrp family transcriptional regulator
VVGRPMPRGRAEDQLLVELGRADVQGPMYQARVQLLHRRWRHAERLFGDPDYLLRVATADIAAYQNLRDEKLATLPGVQRLTSTIVMKRVVDERPFPI